MDFAQSAGGTPPNVPRFIKFIHGGSRFAPRIDGDFPTSITALHLKMQKSVRFPTFFVDRHFIVVFWVRGKGGGGDQPRKAEEVTNLTPLRKALVELVEL